MAYNQWQSSYDFWESGAWKGGQKYNLDYYTQGLPKWTSWGATAGGIVGSLYLGAKIGMTAGTLIGGPLGALAGLGVGLGLGIGWNLGTAGWDYLFGGARDTKFSKLEFRPPVVNTRLAATMRQAAMQQMMASSQSYRQILGREAARLHR